MNTTRFVMCFAVIAAMALAGCGGGGGGGGSMAGMTETPQPPAPQPPAPQPPAPQPPAPQPPAPQPPAPQPPAPQPPAPQPPAPQPPAPQPPAPQPPAPQPARSFISPARINEDRLHNGFDFSQPPVPQPLDPQPRARATMFSLRPLEERFGPSDCAGDSTARNLKGQPLNRTFSCKIFRQHPQGRKRNPAYSPS